MPCWPRSTCVSDRRMSAYRPAFERAATLAELAALAREIYAEDLENGYVTVLGEMVAGGVSDPELGARGRRAHRAVDRDGRAQAASSCSPARCSSRSSRRATSRSRSSRCTSASTCSASSRATTPAPSRCSTSALAARRCSPTLLPAPARRRPRCQRDTGVDLVTGAFSYSGSHIAERLLDSRTRACER